MSILLAGGGVRWGEAAGTLADGFCWWRDHQAARPRRQKRRAKILFASRGRLAVGSYSGGCGAYSAQLVTLFEIACNRVIHFVYDALQSGCQHHGLREGFFRPRNRRKRRKGSHSCQLVAAAAYRKKRTSDRRDAPTAVMFICMASVLVISRSSRSSQQLSLRDASIGFYLSRSWYVSWALLLALQPGPVDSVIERFAML